MWRCKDSERYCVSTKIWRSPELIQLLSVKSMSRYLPPNGTAAFDRSPVKGRSLSPTPPAITITNTFSIFFGPRLIAYYRPPRATRGSPQNICSYIRKVSLGTFTQAYILVRMVILVATELTASFRSNTFAKSSASFVSPITFITQLVKSFFSAFR
jgi:hypothetical protein